MNSGILKKDIPQDPVTEECARMPANKKIWVKNFSLPGKISSIIKSLKQKTDNINKKINKKSKNSKNIIITKEHTTQVISNILKKDTVPDKAFQDLDMTMSTLLTGGLGITFQEDLCKNWKEDNLWCMTKYKPVDKKVRPVNQPMPQSINPPLQRPPLSRDPYKTPLTPWPPDFQPTAKITEERLGVINFGPEGWLLPEEVKLFRHLIILRQNALAFCPAERGLLKHSYGLPYVIPVIEHTPWQKKPIPIPAAIRDEYIELVRECVRTKLYEQSTSSYSIPVFCVKKHDGKLRIVHDLQEMNKVTIKDAGLPPATEEFIESFAGRACYGLGDIMGGYDERELAEESRPLTTFDTPLGRFQLTRLPQGATNSVAVYQAQMMWILQEEIPEHVGIFIDNGVRLKSVS